MNTKRCGIKRGRGSRRGRRRMLGVSRASQRYAREFERAWTPLIEDELRAVCERAGVELTRCAEDGFSPLGEGLR